MDIIDRLQIEARWNPHQPVWREIIGKIEELQHALKRAEISLEGKRTEIEQLRAFARVVMRYWPYWPESDVDGGNLQDIAVRCGVLTTSIMFAPCGDNCLCADTISDDEFADGITCYRKVDWLMGDDE